MYVLVDCDTTIKKFLVGTILNKISTYSYLDVGT